MYRYVIKRILQMIIIVICAAIVVFTLMYFAPGDPARLQLGTGVAEEVLAQRRHELGIDQPYLVQLGQYLYSTFLRFDFGISWQYNVKVMDELLVRLPRTLAISIPAMFLNVIGGTILGIFAAIHVGRWQDSLSMVVAMVLVSAPDFWVALMLTILFGVKLGWLPISGFDTWKCYILPVICTALPVLAVNVRQARSSMLEVIRADFVTTARAKGQRSGVIVRKHMFPNALMPIITGVAGGLSKSVAGSPVIETVFAIPGIGAYLLTGVNMRDRPVVCGCVVFFAIFTSIVVLLMDLCYAFLDPRIKAQYSK